MEGREIKFQFFFFQPNLQSERVCDDWYVHVLDSCSKHQS